MYTKLMARACTVYHRVCIKLPPQICAQNRTVFPLSQFNSLATSETIHLTRKGVWWPLSDFLVVPSQQNAISHVTWVAQQTWSFYQMNDISAYMYLDTCRCFGGSPIGIKIIVHKVAVRAANSFSLNHLCSRPLLRWPCSLAVALHARFHNFCSVVCWSTCRRGHSIIVKYLNALISNLR